MNAGASPVYPQARWPGYQSGSGTYEEYWGRAIIKTLSWYYNKDELKKVKIEFKPICPSQKEAAPEYSGAASFF